MTDRPGDEAVLRHVRGAGILPGVGCDSLRDDEAVEPGPRRYKRWTKQRKDAFLEALATTCNVSEAARVVKVQRASAYSLRLRDADFSAGWAVALERGYGELEMHLVRQVRDGTLRTEKIYDCEKGEVTHIKLIHSFPLTVGIALLASHRSKVEEHRQAASGDGASVAGMGLLDRELDRIRERLLASPTNPIGEDGSGD